MPVGNSLTQRYLTPLTLLEGHTHLRREDAPEGGEGVIESLVINGILQVFDKDVAHTRLSKPWVSWDHMIRIGWPLIISKFIVSSARSAGEEARRERNKLGDIYDPKSRWC